MSEVNSSSRSFGLSSSGSIAGVAEFMRVYGGIIVSHIDSKTLKQRDKMFNTRISSSLVLSIVQLFQHTLQCLLSSS